MARVSGLASAQGSAHGSIVDSFLFLQPSVTVPPIKAAEKTTVFQMVVVGLFMGAREGITGTRARAAQAAA